MLDTAHTVYVLQEDKLKVLDDTDIVETYDGNVAAPPSASGEYQAREYYGAPLEPYDGIWVGAGQDGPEHFLSFVDSMTDGGVSYPPAIAMYYTDYPVRTGNTDPIPFQSQGTNEAAPSMAGYFTLIEDGLGAESFYLPQIGLRLQSRLVDLGASCGDNLVQTVHLQTNGDSHSFRLQFLGRTSVPIFDYANGPTLQDALQHMYGGEGGAPQWQVTKILDGPNDFSWDVSFCGDWRQTSVGTPTPSWFSLSVVSIDPADLGAYGWVTTDHDGSGLSFGGIPVDIPLGMSDYELTSIGIAPENRDESIEDVVAMFTHLHDSSRPSGTRPFFLRIGYEVNGAGSNYCPERYREAYRRIVSALRATEIKFAAVWHVECAQGWGYDWSAYYPGDEWVDWIGTSIFWQSHLVHVDGVNDFENQEALLEFATKHHKPVMFAESSPIEYGVAKCASEGGLPGDPEPLPCEGPPDPGQEAWNFWFTHYFQMIKDNPCIKAFCYINRDWNLARYMNGMWRKNAQLASNDIVEEAFRNEMANSIFRQRDEIAAEIDRPQPLRVASDGGEWLRVLANGDMVLTKGDVRENHTEWSTASALSAVPAFAVADEQGRALVCVNSDNGNLYLRGALTASETGDPVVITSNPTTTEFRYSAADAILMQIADDGSMAVRGRVRSNQACELAEHSFGFPRNYEAFGCEPESAGECACFRNTEWHRNSPCRYTGGTKATSVPHLLETIYSQNEVPLVAVYDDGSMFIPNGQVHADGASWPSSSEEIILLQCEGAVKAKLVVVESEGGTFGHLCLAGRAIIVRQPGEPGETCSYTVRDPEGFPCAQIDDGGNLILRGFLYVNGAISRDVHNWPFKPGAIPIYE